MLQPAPGLSPFSSYSCALFCAHAKLNSLIFNRFRTHCRKHPGVRGGVRLVDLLFFLSPRPVSPYQSRFRLRKLCALGGLGVNSDSFFRLSTFDSQLPTFNLPVSHSSPQ